MVEFAAADPTENGLSEFAGTAADRLYVDGVVSEASEGLAPSSPALVEVPFTALDDVQLQASSLTSVGLSEFDADGEPACQGPGSEWFGAVHVVPRTIDAGNVLSDVTYSIDIFNADTSVSTHSLNASDVALGEGASITDLPSLPSVLDLFETITLTLQILADGPAVFDGDITFEIDAPYDLVVAVFGRRLIVWHFVPEAPVDESLTFSTDLLTARSGKRQAQKLRVAPRQSWSYDHSLRLRERSRMENLLFDWQSRLFGVPMWVWYTKTTVAYSSGVTTLAVLSTDYADYRVGSLVFVYYDEDTFDALEVESLTSSSVTLASPTNFDFPEGSLVMPMRTAYATDVVTGTRQPVLRQDVSVDFTVDENDVDLADASGFSTRESLVYLDDPNIVAPGPARFSKVAYVQDGGVGKLTQTSLYDRGRFGSSKGWFARTRQQAWELRGLLYHLAGRFRSFLIPSFYEDLVVAQDLISGSNAMVIENVGYTEYVNLRRARIRVELVDGTTYERTITNAVETSSSIETLTLDDTWPAAIAASDVARVSYVYRVALTSDTITIQHRDTGGQLSAESAFEEVFE